MTDKMKTTARTDLRQAQPIIPPPKPAPLVDPKELQRLEKMRKPPKPPKPPLTDDGKALAAIAEITVALTAIIAVICLLGVTWTVMWAFLSVGGLVWCCLLLGLAWAIEEGATLREQPPSKYYD